MLTRRELLSSVAKHASLISLAPFVPGFVCRSALAAKIPPDAPVLVLLFLDGGNDGINTVVPFKDEGYRQHRRELRLPEKALLRLNSELALNPAMRSMAKLWETGRLAIIQGVGYPNPSLSHFESAAIWQAARLDADPRSAQGWIGKALDASSPEVRLGSVYVGHGDTPLALRGTRSTATALTNPDELKLHSGSPDVMRATAGDIPLTDFVNQIAVDARASSEQLARTTSKGHPQPAYPRSALGAKLNTMAQLIKGGHGARVYFASQGLNAYDSHANQLIYHGNLLAELSNALIAFLDDLQASNVADRVAVMAFSEFGRRVAENGSFGTDHGTAGPVFVAGAGVRAGMIGKTPSLIDLEHGNLKWSIDFRQVYATFLEQWLDIAPAPVLGAHYETLPLFRT